MKALRWTLAVIVLVLSATMLVGGVVGRYVRTDLLDTDTFVAATAPLAHDPAVQTLLADQVTTQITTHLNGAGLADQVESIAKRFGLPAGASSMLGPIAEQVTAFIQPYVQRFLASPQFAQIWASLIRLAHGDVVRILNGEQPSGGAVSVHGDAVQLALGPVIAAVKDDLVGDGYSVAGAVPDISPQVTLVRSDTVVRAQRYGRWFNRYANWLPIIGAVLLVAGLLLAPRRRIGTVIWLAVFAALLAALLIAIPWGRSRLNGAAAAVYDPLVHGLVVAAWIGLAIAAIVAAALYVDHRRAQPRHDL